MKQAVAFLMPFMDKEKEERRAAGGAEERSSNGKIVMATVKGDVHDIGKNIVGVVLQCNNYEVIDLGVMVPAAKILETAKAEKADIIGLSGLITPSLDEMCHVAAEMERQGCEVPLLIGGATTSRVHTAVKIHPNYHRGQTIHVNDASRAVGVAQSLLSQGKGTYVTELRNEYLRIAQQHARAQEDKARLPLSAARANAVRLDWSGAYQTRWPASIRPMRLATTSSSMPTRRGPNRLPPCTRCASNSRSAKAVSTPRSPTSSRPATAALPIMSAASPSPWVFLFLCLFF